MAFTPFIKRKVCTNVVSHTFVPFIERVRCTPLESAEVSNLSASNVVMGNPVISSPAIGQIYSLNAISVETQNVAIGIPELVEIIPTFIITINTALGTGDSLQLPLPVGQTYNFVVNWGDGNEDTITSYNQAETLHNYSGAFNGQISISGKCGGWSFNNGGDKLKITSVDNWGDVGFENLIGALFGCGNITSIAPPDFDASSMVTLSNFIRDCSSLISIDLTLLDVSNVGSCAFFAKGCTSMTSMDVGTWVTTSLTELREFISGCSSLLSLNSEDFNTSNVLNIDEFALDCLSLVTLGVTNWDVSSVISSGGVIDGCSSLLNINTSNWVLSSTLSIANFAFGCTVLEVLDVSGWDLRLCISTANAFRDCLGIIIIDTDSWDTSNMASCSWMCEDCGNLTSSFDNTLWWDRTVPFTVFVNCFRDAINVPEYVIMPNNWKGL